MATSYNVYRNDGAGGPVDYSTVVANVPGPTYTGAALAASSDTTFAVRATDGVTEESNVDCRCRVILDGSGHDASAIPSPPSTITAVATASGGARVDWAFVPHPDMAAPTGFRAWVTAGGSVDYAAPPAATVAYAARVYRYSAPLSGLTGGASYSVGVRAYNAAGAEANTLRASLVAVASGPSGVDSLAGSATFTA